MPRLSLLTQFTLGDTDGSVKIPKSQQVGFLEKQIKAKKELHLFDYFTEMPYN
jgi:hypothetical protein